MNIRKYRGVLVVIALVMMLSMLFVSCSEPQNEIPGSATINVRVSDNTDAKTITPDGNVNISHYVITVVNEAEGINQSSGYLTKGSMFTVSNVPAGTWYAKVDAYIQRGEEGSYTYVKVASDQSEPKTVQAGANTTFELVLDTLDAVVSGDVTVTLKMPAALSAESAAFWYQYTITGMTDEEFSHTSELLSGTTGADGLATITIDADAIGLMQGAYRFAITVQDAETSPPLTKKGVDVMRLVNGLEAKGTIDLTAYEADQSFDVTITDKIGDILTPALEDGKEVYNLDGQEGSASLTITLSEPLKANETIEWYVDGELDETVNADEAASGKYTLTFTPGSHIVTAIVRDTDTLMAVGSINEFKVSLTTTEFAAKVFTFTLNGDSYSIAGLIAPVGQFEMPESGVLEIPVTYKGKPVTKINSAAFYNRTDITGSIIIPESVTSIGKSAFSGCSSLESVTISDNSQLKIIEEATFFGCSSLTDINIPENVIELGLSAFNGCSSLTSIIIPDGVTSIGNYTFYNCPKLVTVEISDTSQLVTIGSYAFQNCSTLTSITIPDGVTSIGDSVFADCFALETVEISEASQLKSIGNHAFKDCSALTGIKIPNSVTTIRTGVFQNCSALTSINIPDSVTTIGTGAFQNCSALANINIPDSVTKIATQAFDGCSALETIEISDASQLTFIGISVFQNCSSLTSINIPDGVTEIGMQAFHGCSSLETVEIPETSQLESIGYYVFYDCSSLTSINIPDSVTTIEARAFEDCSSLTDIYCEAAEQPEGWDENWLGVCSAEVHWGYTGA